MKIHVRELGQIPLLGPEEEQQLADRALMNDVEARARLIRASIRLVVRIAGEYAQRGMPLLDLIVKGNAGLIQAVDHFNTGCGPFGAHATWCIRHSIEKALAGSRNKVIAMNDNPRMELAPAKEIYSAARSA